MSAADEPGAGTEPRKPRLELATPLLIHSREEILHHFSRFMPDVIQFAKGLRSQP